MPLPTCALAAYRRKTAVVVVPTSAMMLITRKWRKSGKKTNSWKIAPQMICMSLCEQVWRGVGVLVSPARGMLQGF